MKIFAGRLVVYCDEGQNFLLVLMAVSYFCSVDDVYYCGRVVLNGDLPGHECFFSVTLLRAVCSGS